MVIGFAKPIQNIWHTASSGLDVNFDMMIPEIIQLHRMIPIHY